MEKSEISKEELKEVLEQLDLRIKSCITTVKALREWTDEEVKKSVNAYYIGPYFEHLEEYNKQQLEWDLHSAQQCLESASDKIDMILKYELD